MCTQYTLYQYTNRVVCVLCWRLLCTEQPSTTYGTTLHYVRNNPHYVRNNTPLRMENTPLRTEQHSTTYGTTLHYVRNPPLCTEPSTMYRTTLHYVQNNPPLTLITSLTKAIKSCSPISFKH